MDKQRQHLAVLFCQSEEFHNHMAASISYVLRLNVSNILLKKDLDKYVIERNRLSKAQTLKETVQIKMRLANKLLDERYLKQSVETLKKEKEDFVLNFMNQLGLYNGETKDFYFQEFLKLFEKVLLEVTNYCARKIKAGHEQKFPIGI